MLKFALAGCGRIAGKHFESIKQIEEAEIVACCDVIEGGNRVWYPGSLYLI